MFSLVPLLPGCRSFSSSQYSIAGNGSKSAIGAECSLITRLFDKACSESLVLVSDFISFICENPRSHAVLVAGMVRIISISCRIFEYSLLNRVVTCFHINVENFEENLQNNKLTYYIFNKYKEKIISIILLVKTLTCQTLHSVEEATQLSSQPFQYHFVWSVLSAHQPTHLQNLFKVYRIKNEKLYNNIIK